MFVCLSKDPLLPLKCYHYYCGHGEPICWYFNLYCLQSSVVSVTKTYEFAGEEVKVTETVTADSSGKTKEQNTSKPSIGETKKRQVLPEIK